MFNISSVELDWKGLTLKLETGLVARQADGAVMCTLGGTVVLCTVCASRDDNLPRSSETLRPTYGLR